MGRKFLESNAASTDCWFNKIKMKHIRRFIFLAFMTLILFSCGNKKNTPIIPEEDTITANIPTFCEDSALQIVQKQCDFGPRTMGSEAHEKCGKYIVSEFRRFGCKVSLQKAIFIRYDGVKMKGYNIIASVYPKAQKRMMICTHWDSRPWCDHDPDSTKWHEPVLAANDGASGVGVLLEIARVLQKDSLNYGVDLVCFDAEDVGTPEWLSKEQNDDDTWCLGAQYWARHLHTQDIQFAILLDMVGGVGAHFYQEGFSKQYANEVVNRVWNAAKGAGYAEVFPKEEGGMITDDHLPLNRIANIPTIDIIPYYPTSTSGFGPTWHTTQDNMKNISPITLKAVGQTLLYFLFTENI